MLGVFNWILVPILAVSKTTRHARYVKGMVFNSMLQIGVEDWEGVGRGVRERVEGLRRWLGGG